MNRRDFLGAAAVGAVAAGAANAAGDSREAIEARNKIRAFDYDGVKLGKSRWSEQYQRSRDFYLGVSNDDILHGFRAAAGLPAPGKALGGWCSPNSNTVFGQWLSGMSRFARANDDAQMRDKAAYLAQEFAKTVSAEG